MNKLSDVWIATMGTLSLLIVMAAAVYSWMMVMKPEPAEAQVGAARTPLGLEYFFSGQTTVASGGGIFMVRFPKKGSATPQSFATTPAASQSVSYVQITHDASILPSTVTFRVHSRDCPGGFTDHINSTGSGGIWLPAFSSGIDSVRITNASGNNEEFTVLGMR